jgi:hypothetical protein
MSKPQGLVQPEGLGKLIKIIHLIRSQTHDTRRHTLNQNACTAERTILQIVAVVKFTKI